MFGWPSEVAGIRVSTRGGKEGTGATCGEETGNAWSEYWRKRRWRREDQGNRCARVGVGDRGSNKSISVAEVKRSSGVEEWKNRVIDKLKGQRGGLVKPIDWCGGTVLKSRIDSRARTPRNRRRPSMKRIRITL